MRLYGKNSVLERLKVNPQTIKKFYLQKDIDLKDSVRLIHKTKIPYISLPADYFAKHARGKSAQGIIAEVQDYQYCLFEDLLEYPEEKQPTLLFLDRITDPQNLGAILRTTACFGGFALVLPKYQSVEINETVLHIAAGGENYTPVAKVTNLSYALDLVKEKGYCVAGAVVKGGQNLMSTQLEFPLCLVIGSEGQGIRQGLISKFDFKLSLPMQGADFSFNVATACALFCYEITRQRENKK